MEMPARISIKGVKINSVDRLAKISLSSTFQVGNHVHNKRSEAFGEHNGDRGIFHQPELIIDDSDLEDSTSEKLC